VRGVPAVHGEQRGQRVEGDLGRMTSRSPLNTHTTTVTHRKTKVNDAALALLRRRRHARQAAARSGASRSLLCLAERGRRACTREEHLLLQFDESRRRHESLRELRAEGALTRRGGRELCAEPVDLVHGAFAGGGGGDGDKRGGGQRDLAWACVLQLELGDAAGFARRSQLRGGNEKAGG
jgi:hypothetical protein